GKRVLWVGDGEAHVNRKLPLGVAFSGGMTISGSDCGYAVFDAGTGKKKADLPDGRQDAAARISPDGTLAIILDKDFTPGVYDLVKGTRRNEKKGRMFGSGPAVFGWLPSGDRALIADRFHNTLHLMDSTGASIAERRVDACQGMVPHPDGRRTLFLFGRIPALVENSAIGAERDDPALPGSRIKSAIRPLMKQSEFRGHEALVTIAVFSADGNLLLTGAEDRTAALWDVQKSELLAVYKEHEKPVTFVAFLAGGRVATSADGEEAIRLWPADLIDEFRRRKARDFRGFERERYGLEEKQP
ncbi:MAG TPA: WD40 repeat domain-containing protein, partial [Planctomycetia bacterium]|nr:WD40 repeat domain-containing protein [Planctomycetia bacterium]